MILITGDGISLTGANVYDLSIDNYYTNGIAAEIGTAVASELTLSIKGYFDLDGKELAVSVDNIFRGYFTVDEVKRTRKGMTVSALDRMVKFDKDFTSIALPANLTTLVTDACTKCGVPYGGVTFRTNSGVTIGDLPEAFTYRELLMWIGEITGTCSFIDTDGKFYMRWYSGSADINKSLYYEGGEFVAEQISITGYKYKDVQVGTEGYIAELTNNQILDLRDDVETLLGNLPLDSYYPFNVDTREVVLNPLTLATFTDYDGIEYPTLVTHYTYKYGKKNKVKASGQSMVELGRNKLNPLTSHQQQIILSMKNDIEADITMREQILLSLNEQINNSVGLYVTEYEGKTYQHDKPNLVDSNYITTQTSGGFAWTTDGWNDGSPVWNYGVDKDGNAILNILSVLGLVADWIVAGTIRSQDGSVVINLDNSTFNFADHIIFDESGFNIKLDNGRTLEEAIDYASTLTQDKQEGIILFTDKGVDAIVEIEMDGMTMQEEGATPSTPKLLMSVANEINIYSGAPEPYNPGLWRRCNLADDGTVLAYYGDEGYKEDGSNGQVMVEIHKGYMKTELYDDGRLDSLISAPWEGYEVHPAFIRDEYEIDFIYMSAYEGSIFDVSEDEYLLEDEQVAKFTEDLLCSIADAKPCSGVTQDLNIVNCRKLAQNRGEGWEQQDFWTYQFVSACMFIEGQTYNSQTAFGNGVTNVNDTSAGNTLNNAVKTGLTTSLGNASGQVPYVYNYPGGGSVTTYPMSYHGIENLYGNIYKWVDGFNIYNNEPFVADHNFESNKTDGAYKSLGFTMPNSDDYVANWAKAKCVFLPSEVGTNRIGDYYYQAAGFRVARVGGQWSAGGAAGVAIWALTYGAASRDRRVGARLLFIPKLE